MKKLSKKTSWLPLILLVLTNSTLTLCAQADFLKGSVEQEEVLKPPAQNMQRRSSEPGDPFSAGEEQKQNVPMQSFEPVMPPPQMQIPQQQQQQAPPKGFDLEAALDKQIPDNWPGQQQTPMPGQQNPMSGQPEHPAYDPDQSPEMQLAWDAWHRRVAEAIYSRFSFFAKAAFQFSPPIACRVSYVISRTGQVGNINILQKSNNMMFNMLITTVIKSVNGDKDLLKFPEGSQRQYVQKIGVFTQNYGGVQGFRYTTGDRETIRGH